MISTRRTRAISTLRRSRRSKVTGTTRLVAVLSSTSITRLPARARLSLKVSVYTNSNVLSLQSRVKTLTRMVVKWAKNFRQSQANRRSTVGRSPKRPRSTLASARQCKTDTNRKTQIFYKVADAIPLQIFKIKLILNLLTKMYYLKTPATVRAPKHVIDLSSDDEDL